MPSSDKTVIIEMQVLNVLGFEKRVLYNAAKAFSIQLAVGEDYTLLNPIIALTITDFEMFENSPKVISRYRLKEKDELTDYSDDIELVFVELPKFKKDLDDLQNLTEKWLYFLQSASKLNAVPPSLNEVPAIQHAFKVAKQSKLTKKELDILENRIYTRARYHLAIDYNQEPVPPLKGDDKRWLDNILREHNLR